MENLHKDCKRVAIYCYYDKKGVVGRDALLLLKDLKKSVDYLIVVVNGILNQEKAFQSIADEVVMRENSGYDSGAYKRILLDEKYTEIFKKADELVLCNSSFFGPFISFAEIFRVMEDRQVDFWGISSYARGIVEHLQSYFLVFRRRVLDGDVLYNYFRSYVCEATRDYMEICAVFENGLFQCLTEAGYCYDAYVKGISCHNYKNPYGSMAIDRVPVLKKKVFSKEYFVEKNILDALSFLNREYEYDIGPVLEGAERIYDVSIQQEKVTAHVAGAAAADWADGLRVEKREEIRKLVAESQVIYIYGAGVAGTSMYMTFFSYKDRQKLKGFVVSDDQMPGRNKWLGYPVYRLCEVHNISDAAVIVGLEKENSRKVRKNLNGVKRLVYLWDE